MNAPPRPLLNASQMRQIDEICNAFESAYSIGQQPRIEEYLAQAAPELHRQLLSELVQVEMHYRPQTSVNEYASRFPEFHPEQLESTSTDVVPDYYPAIPGYSISSELGRGGMGVVYLATDLRLLRQVALKMIHPSGQLDAEHRRRFLGEARAAARLHHPNLVQVFDAGEWEGRPYLVFELVEGGTLSEKIRTRSLSFQDSAKLMEQVCRATHFAHQRHIVHRDLKPSNILIGLDGLPRIGDFGLAKRLDEDSQQTVSGVLVGTPSYMAPEQASGHTHATSAAVDIYSLGAILYEMLVGHPPLKAASVMETLDLLRTREPTPPRSIDRKVPRDLETICLKCLQKEPARRYLSARVMADDLASYLNGDSIVARPSSTLERTGRWCRRHPLPAALVTALAIVILVGFAAVWSQWRVARYNAEQYRRERDTVRAAVEVAQAKTAEAEQHRLDSEKHLAASESRFRKAQAPVQELIRLGSELMRQPNMNARGRKALEQATLFLKDLMNDKQDDPQAMTETAFAVSTFGWTLLEHGLFVEGEAAMRDAQAITSQLIALSPTNLRYRRLHRDAVWQHGIAQLRLGNHERAEQVLRESVLLAEGVLKLPNINSSDHVSLGAAYSNLAVELGANRKFAEAAQARLKSVEVLRRCAEKFPRDGSIPSNLSLALFNMAADLWGKDKVAAEKMANEALEIRRAMVNRTQAPREESAYLVASLLQLANWYRDAQRIEQGETLLTEAMKYSELARQRFPEVYSVRLEYINSLRATLRFDALRSTTGRDTHRFESLERELDLAIRDFPSEDSFKHTRTRAMLEQGEVCHRRGDTSEAMAHFATSLSELRRLRSSTSNSNRYAGDINRVAQMILNTGLRFEYESEKIAAVDAQRELAPENAVLLNVLAWRLTCCADLALQDLTEAERYARQAVALRTAEPFYYNTLAVCLFYQNRLAESEAAFDQSQRLKTPEPAADWYFLARIRARQGQQADAIDYFERADQWRQQNRANDPELLRFAEEAGVEL